MSKRRNNKAVAEFQFNSSAPPVSLGSFLNETTIEFSLSVDHIDDIDDYAEFDPQPLIIPNNVPENTDPRSLVLFANSLDSEKYEIEKFRVHQQDLESKQNSNSEPKHDEIIPIPENKSVLNIDFQINNARTQQSLKDLKVDRPIPVAVKTVLDAVKLFPDPIKNELQITGVNSNHDRMLIDKSPQSFQFINETCRKIQLLVEKSLGIENELLKFNDIQHDKRFIQQYQPTTQREKLLVYSMIGKYIKPFHIDFNLKVILDIDPLDEKYNDLSCHNLLCVLGFCTVDDQDLTNYSNLVNNFPRVFGGTRLYYLEYLLKEWKTGLLFHESIRSDFRESFHHPYQKPVPLSSMIEMVRRSNIKKK